MDDLNVWQLRNEEPEEGELESALRADRREESGGIEQYELFSGIHFYRMDLCLDSISCEDMTSKLSSSLFTVTHCRKGRLEGELTNGEILYLGEGDVTVNMPGCAIVRSSFPLSHFQGIVLALEIDKAMDSLRKLSGAFGTIPIDFADLQDRLLSDNQVAVYRSSQRLNHVFSEMYDGREKDKEFYLRVKVLELLHEISLAWTGRGEACRTYRREQVEAVKEVRNFLVDQLDSKYTLEELARKFSVPVTLLKEGFREVYGSPVNTYLRSYRVKVASELLRDTGMSVAQIAEKVGYANQSKFAEVFRQRTHLTPMEYRNLF